MASKRKFALTVLLVQLLFIVFYAFFLEYGEELDATSPRNFYLNSTITERENLLVSYPMFQDTNAMIFIGVGFLYTFLKKYGYSGVGMNMLIAAISVQWSLITHNWWNTSNGKIQLDLKCLLSGEFAAASAVIALGGVFGKIGPLQMVIFTLIEVFLYTTNEHFCIDGFLISDVAGSVSLHMFAGVFGCAAAYSLDRKKNVQDNPNEANSYNSNLFCMIGTVLLWCFWPSFNAALTSGHAQYRAVMNTFLALLGSCLAAFAVSSLLDKEKKFTMSHIQNASLAGGVAIGTTADLMIQPFGALLIGSLGGSISVLGFQYVSPFLARIKLYDPCGINSLHAIPGFFAGVTGIIATSFATEKYYGHNLYTIYPAMAPLYNSSALIDIQVHSPDISPGIGRTVEMQACFQVIYIVEVLLAALITGLITGFVLRSKIFDPLEEKEMYLDDVMWNLPEATEKSNISDQPPDTKF